MIYPRGRFAPSPNCGPRGGSRVECVVIHHISLPPGEFGGGHVERFFRNSLDPNAHPYFATIAKMRVSAHFFIERRGAVIQFVDTDYAAWHAGVSEWKGREGVNLFSVGVELEGDEESPYTEEQYRSLGTLLAWLKSGHPAITAEALVGHEHVAPGRKRDPGPNFDWERVRSDFTRLTKVSASA